jgi:hypothetical protein
MHEPLRFVNPEDVAKPRNFGNIFQMLHLILRKSGVVFFSHNSQRAEGIAIPFLSHSFSSPKRRLAAFEWGA